MSVNPINPKLLRFHQNRRWALDQQRNTPFSTPRDIFSMRDVGAQSGSNSLVTHWMDATLHLTRDKHETMAQQFTISVASQRLYLYQPPQPIHAIKGWIWCTTRMNDTKRYEKSETHQKVWERERESDEQVRDPPILLGAQIVNRRHVPRGFANIQENTNRPTPNTQPTTHSHSTSIHHTASQLCSRKTMTF